MNKYFSIVSISLALGFALGYGVRSMSNNQAAQQSLVNSHQDVDVVQIEKNSEPNAIDTTATVPASNELVLNSANAGHANEKEIEDALDKQLVSDTNREQWRELLVRGDEDEIHLLSAYAEDTRPENDPERVAERKRLSEKAQEVEKYLPEVMEQ